MTAEAALVVCYSTLAEALTAALDPGRDTRREDDGQAVASSCVATAGQQGDEAAPPVAGSCSHLPPVRAKTAQASCAPQTPQVRRMLG